MAVDTPYTTEALITRLVGELGLDLRADDDPGATDDFMDDAIDAGTVAVDKYLYEYSVAGIAASRWAQEHATWFAVRRWCQRRLNDVPVSVEKECEERKKELELIRTRRSQAPRIAKTRRPAVVTTHTVDLRQYNNQVRVDKTRSSGRAEGYRRPDSGAPDNR